MLRAVFPNPKRELLPGMFVRAQLTRGTRSAALLVPQRGVSRNAKGEATVMVVDKEDKVNERVVTADRAINGEWLITAGLTAGERVVLDGLQKVKPGAPVKPVPAAEQVERRRCRRAPPPKSPSAKQRVAHAVPILHRPAHLRVGHRHHRHDRRRVSGGRVCRCASTRRSRRRRSAST